MMLHQIGAIGRFGILCYSGDIMKFEKVVEAIKKLRERAQPVVVGIEGFGGAGKSTLANKLKEALGNAYIVQTDDFVIEEKLTLVSPDMECYDLQRLEKEVLAPAKRGEAISYRKLEWDTFELGEPVHVPPVDYLIVEGITAYYPTIAKYYDCKIWVDTPIEVATKRGREKDAGTVNEQHWDLWSKNDVAYKAKYRPDEVADFVVANQ